MVTRLHDDEGVGHARRHRIRRDFGGTDLADDLVDLGEGFHACLKDGLHLDGLGEAGTRDT